MKLRNGCISVYFQHSPYISRLECRLLFQLFCWIFVIIVFVCFILQPNASHEYTRRRWFRRIVSFAPARRVHCDYAKNSVWTKVNDVNHFHWVLVHSEAEMALANYPVNVCSRMLAEDRETQSMIRIIIYISVKRIVAFEITMKCHQKMKVCFEFWIYWMSRFSIKSHLL